MSSKDKIIKRFKNQPKDFTLEELVRLFGLLGFTVDNKGKTSGSRILFINGEEAHTVHKPHPSNVIKEYAMKQILNFLIEKGLINDYKKDK